MKITDEMIARLADEAGWPVWVENSHRAFREGYRAALAVQPAEPLALPPLPEPSGHTWGYDAQMRMTKTPNGHYTAGDFLAYARACAAAWGVTLADEGGAK